MSNSSAQSAPVIITSSAARMLPLTSSVCSGVVVPIPTLPVVLIIRFLLLPPTPTLASSRAVPAPLPRWRNPKGVQLQGARAPLHSLAE